MTIFSNLTVNEDKHAKTAAFFCQQKNIAISQKVITQMLKVSETRGNCDLRICLHQNKDENFQQMVILQHRGQYRVPHKHNLKEEAYQMIKGQMLLFLFDNKGQVKEKIKLNPKTNFIYRIGKNEWHLTVPLSQIVIFQEMKPGPFLGEKDSIFPAWAPTVSQKEHGMKFLVNLLKLPRPNSRKIFKSASSELKSAEAGNVSILYDMTTMEFRVGGLKTTKY